MIPLGPGDPLRLGPYRLVGVLGAGGMGKVYFGHDNQGRPAAVKVLLPHLAHDQHLVQRFLREAEAARAVTGKGVARVLAAMTEGGRPWIASEFLAGPTLDQAVASYGPLPDEALRALAAALAEALGTIHAAGLVHRDLKPANIVLTSTGPRIIDFGIARPEHGLTLTTTGQVPVTPGYGAPEQVLGQRVGPAADVFSLGAVLAFAASGRRAYDGTHVAAVQYAVVHEEPDLHQVPAALRPLIGPCLAKDPSFRPTPDQIRTEFAPPHRAGRIWQQGPLATDIHQRETSARQLSTLPGTVVSPLPGRRRFLGLAAGAAVVLAGGGTAAWLMTSDSETGDSSAKGSDKGSGTPKTTTGTPGGRLWGPLAVADPWSPPALAIGDVMVFGAKEGGLVAHGVVDGRKKWEALDITPSSEFAVLPDGPLLTGDAGGTVHALDPATGKEQWTADCGAAVILGVSEKAFYVVTRDEKIRAVDAGTRKVLWTVPSSFGSGYGAVGGDRLILSSDKGEVTALDAGSGKKVWSRKAGSFSTVPVVHEDTVVLGGAALARVRLDTGKDVWSVPSGPAGAILGWGSPAVDDEHVYAIDGESLNCRRLDDGAKVWTHPLKAPNIPYYAPQILGDHVCEVTGKNPKSFDAVALDKATGKQAWTRAQGSLKSLKLTSDGERLFLLQAENVTALSRA
ncbi:serine/threonine-protein kinase [Streptomyces sp. NPDC058685]|uniref:serine/threonine-protein kinase n=1 Tax=Streptomyces sp. NPDC058685 TaxID=3346598 RepID=UPI00366362D9